MALIALGIVASHRTPHPAPGLPVVSGLHSWWDAGDLSTITASAGRASQWNDKSGWDHHLVQNTASAKPYTGVSIGAYSALGFFGTQVMLTMANVNIPPPYTAIAVVQSYVNGANNHEVFGFNTNPQSATLYGGNGWTLYYGPTLESGVAVDMYSHAVIATVPGATAATIHLDGAAIASGSAGGMGWVNMALPIGAASEMYSGWNGMIGEVIVYTRALPNAERQQIESYLRTKWGTP